MMDEKLYDLENNPIKVGDIVIIHREPWRGYEALLVRVFTDDKSELKYLVLGTSGTNYLNIKTMEDPLYDGLRQKVTLIKK